MKKEFTLDEIKELQTITQRLQQLSAESEDGIPEQNEFSLEPPYPLDSHLNNENVREIFGTGLKVHFPSAQVDIKVDRPPVIVTQSFDFRKYDSAYICGNIDFKNDNWQMEFLNAEEFLRVSCKIVNIYNPSKIYQANYNQILNEIDLYQKLETIKFNADLFYFLNSYYKSDFARHERYLASLHHKAVFIQNVL